MAAVETEEATTDALEAPVKEPRRDKEGSLLGGTIGLLGGIGGGAPLAPAGGTVTGGTAIGMGWGDGAWSSEWFAAAAAANAEYFPPGARCIVAVGCILAGEGDEGAVTVCDFCATAADVIEAKTALAAGIAVWVDTVPSLPTVADCAAIVAEAAIWGNGVKFVEAVAIPVRRFIAGVRDKAIPVVGPDTGTLDTVAVGWTILAILTIGAVHPSSEKC